MYAVRSGAVPLLSFCFDTPLIASSLLLLLRFQSHRTDPVAFFFISFSGKDKGCRSGHALFRSQRHVFVARKRQIKEKIHSFTTPSILDLFNSNHFFLHYLCHRIIFTRCKKTILFHFLTLIKRCYCLCFSWQHSS